MHAIKNELNTMAIEPCCEPQTNPQLMLDAPVKKRVFCKFFVTDDTDYEIEVGHFIDRLEAEFALGKLTFLIEEPLQPALIEKGAITGSHCLTNRDYSVRVTEYSDDNDNDMIMLESVVYGTQVELHGEVNND